MLANRTRPAPAVSALLLAALLAAACVPAPRPARAPVPQPGPSSQAAPVPLAMPATAPQPAPPATPQPAPRLPAGDWRDVPQTPGIWKWGMDGESSVARFGEDGDVPRVTLTCSPLNRAVTLRVAGAPRASGAASGDAAITVTTTGARRMLAAAADPGGGTAAVLPPSDPILDEIAFSRGRFMLELPGMAPLYLPVWPEIGRVTEDCR